MKNVCLIVMDGWGVNTEREGNATLLAATPNLTRLYKTYPSTAIETSGTSVGLPPGQMGNSEVGHLTMGAGRVVYQDLTRIDKAVKDGEFLRHPVLNVLLDALKAKGGALHLMGLVSDGGVHSHIKHLYALIDAASKRGLDKVFIHAFLDGRDTPPTSGAGYVESCCDYLKKAGVGEIATVSGRFYAMDRDNRWERVEKAYAALVYGKGQTAVDPVAAIMTAYGRGETDEFVPPTVILKGGKPVGTIDDGDGVLFFNFRSDRAREITRALTFSDFDGFKREKVPALAGFVCMAEYDKRFGFPVLFKHQAHENILGELFGKKGINQFRVSETEKYAHVTFFFNGGREEPFPGEIRFLIPSIKDVPTYDKKPEMRAMEIANAAAEKIREGMFGFILLNFANGDMVGHTGVLDAAIKACEAVDKGVGVVVEEALKNGWAVLITADHGNAERMFDGGKHLPHTAHTTGPVPFLLVDGDCKGIKLRANGALKDVAPTVLKLMGIDKPVEMDGTPLF